jgi:hypothetical protein
LTSLFTIENRFEVVAVILAYRKSGSFLSRAERKGDAEMKKLILPAATVFALAPAPAFGAGNPSGTGQPSQTCLSSTAPSEPGNAASAPGSAFNENGGNAGSMYAGSQPQNSNNPKSVSQYDVACFQVSQH